jgi:hypothetical protein
MIQKTSICATILELKLCIKVRPSYKSMVVVIFSFGDYSFVKPLDINL